MIQSIPNDSFVLVVLAGIAILTTLLIGAILALRTRRFFEDLRIRRRFRRGARGETQAEAFLKQKGFRVRAVQPEMNCRFFVDNQTVGYRIRADFLVSRKGRRAIVEVKTGSSAPDPRTSATRRQLLEYACCYAVDDVFLFDAERGELREVRFPVNPQRSPAALYAAFLVLGALLGLIFSRFF